ncbi:hypothetical protein AVEN_142858-1 [Araneus ventricosus]|uniref:Uncharacterized protein n=1 Tax=Araneus ventricosus TaxID=182803 RepID=A0A4Y2R9W7_ARAVE|nr:hypothetical protein AVEN_142858-1 [Araneus ventricosus]
MFVLLGLGCRAAAPHKIILISIVTIASRLGEGYHGMDLVVLNRGHMTRETPELVLLSSNFRITPEAGRLATAYDLACSRPTNTVDLQRNRVSAWYPQDQRPTPYH